MKKINLFNRNTNLPSYRRMPVSRGFNRGGGIPLFSGMTKKICHKFPSREGWRVAPAGVWFAALVALFIATPSFATDPDPVAQKTVASKAYVDTKQDIIQTGNVLFYDGDGTLDDPDLYVPGLVAYDPTTGSLKGNQIGILDHDTVRNDEGTLPTYSNAGGHGAEMDNYVPTVRAVAEALQLIWDGMPYWTALTWGSAETISTNAYDITFVGDTGATANAWPSADKTKLINTAALANSLALKQNKISKSGYYYNTSGTLTAYGNSSATNGWSNAGVKGTGLVTKTATEGVVGERKIFEATDVANYHADGMSQNAQNIQDISIPTVGAVMSIVSTNAPTGTPGNVAMYDATTGALSDGVATYDGSTTYNASTDADKIAVMSGVQRKKECGGYEPAPAGQPAHDGTHPGDEDYCWLWIFPD